jgi:hypothetical protein
MSVTKSELNSLFLDEGASEQALDLLLSTTLAPLIGFTREGKLVTKPQFLSLSDTSRVLAALLAQQAMVRLGLAGASAESTADDLSGLCQVSLKSCRELLSRLKGRRLLEKSDRGYTVPTWAIADAARAVSGK